MLGYEPMKAIARNKINDNYKKNFENINIGMDIHVHTQPKTIFINEYGLYEVLTKSSKPIAKQFLDKYLTEIMPQIRQTGKYIANKTDMNKIKKLNEKISNYKTELNYYNDKYKFVFSKFGYLYICEDNQVKNGIEIKCFKVGYDLDMTKRIREYKVGNFKHKLLAYIPLKIDRKQIEKCVKMRLKPHLTKLVTDTICYISFNSLKKEIIDCINFASEHVCHCVRCSKIYKLESIDKHKCNITNKKEIIDYKHKNNQNIKISSKKSSKKISKKSSKKISKKSPKKILKK